MKGHPNGLTRLALANWTKLKLNGDFSKKIKSLIESGFVGEKCPYINNKKCHVYYLKDYFTLFYLKFKKDKSNMDKDYWTNSYKNPSRVSWQGYAFERICFDHLKEIKKALGFANVTTDVYAFNYRSNDEDGAQIDLIFNRKDHVPYVK